MLVVDSSVWIDFFNDVDHPAVDHLAGLLASGDLPIVVPDLVLFEVAHFEGEPQPRDGQRLKWVALAALADEDILEADRPFIAALQRRATGSA